MNGAQYFLHAINCPASTGALALYPDREKEVPLPEAGWTFIFQLYVEAILLAVAFWWRHGLPLTSPGRCACTSARERS